MVSYRSGGSCSPGLAWATVSLVAVVTALNLDRQEALDAQLAHTSMRVQAVGLQ